MFFRANKKSATLFAPLVLFSFADFLCSAALAEPGLLLKQRGNLAGDAIAGITKGGFEAANTIGHLRIVSHAPKWTVLLANTKSHTYVETTADKFTSPPGPWQMSPANIGLLNVRWKKERTAEICGFKAQILVPTIPVTSTQGTRNIRYFVLDEPFHFPREIEVIMAKVAGLPIVDGIPLRFEYLDHDGHHHVSLNTTSIEKKDIKIAHFVPPANYRRVGSLQEVLLDEDALQAISDFFGASPTSSTQSK